MPEWLTDLVEAAGATLEEEEIPAEQVAEAKEEALEEWLAEIGEEQVIAEEAPVVEELVPPEGAIPEAPEAEAQLLARLEEMSPEEAFAAWEALLAEGEGKIIAPTEVVAPEELEPAGPVVIEAPEEEAVAFPESIGGEATGAEAELLARMEGLSPEEAFAAWEALLAESEVAPEVAEERAPAPEEAPKTEEAWMALVEDEGGEEVETPVVTEEPLPAEALTELDQEWESLLEKALLAEPVVEEEQVWMPLAEDEGLEEIAALPVSEEAPAPTEIEAPAEPEEPPVELPDWALAEAVEMAPEGLPSMAEEVTLGPDLVLLTEEEEIQAAERAEQARAIPADLGELMPELEELIGEEAVVAAETRLAEPELPGKPTWVAVEEEAAEEELVVPAPSVEEQPITADDDEVGLALARQLWATGQEEDARTAYERLLNSRLRDVVIEDLEKITIEEARKGPMLRLLGDAYMKADRLQEALAAYRRALAGY